MDPGLLGTPLAGPWRRLAAMLLDLAILGLVLLVKEISFALFGFLVAWVLFRLSSPATRIGGHTKVSRRTLRASATVVLVISVISFVGNCFGGPDVTMTRDDDEEDAPRPPDAPTRVDLGLGDLLQGAGSVMALRQASDREEAERAARRLALQLRRAGVPRPDVHEAMGEMMGPAADSAWADEVVAAAVGAADSAVAGADSAAPAADSVSVDTLLASYAAARDAGDPAAADSARRRLAAALAAEESVALRREVRRLRRALEEAAETRRAREGEEEMGIVALFRTLLDDLGLGLGWLGLYFTVVTVLTGGQTVGKRLLGIRVMRLNGEPIGWWLAFGRFGGYAASVATGLLGFLEVFWDANRQCMQDKLAGTVVIRPAAKTSVETPKRWSGEGERPSPRRASAGAGGDAGVGTRSGSSHAVADASRGARPGSSALVLVPLLALCLGGCGAEEAPEGTVLTFPGSAVGAEAEILSRQLERFMARHPHIRVEQRRTPDAADQRHQLYVQWLNAGADDPDILQLDVIWTPEFAAAGWVLPLDRFRPDTAAFFPAAVQANRWADSLYALPWFVDVGMLYWRTDVMDAPPQTLAALRAQASEAMEREGLRYGFVWQGARYEGLVTVFLEHLGAYGGRIQDDAGRIVVDSDAGVRALTYMRETIYEAGISPRSVLTWQEEQTRFAFQNGGAAFMRNWPYAYALMQDSSASEVAGSFAVAPMPAAPGGRPTAALGGSQLAINANTEDPEAAWTLVEFLTRPEQMLERARLVGQYPTRPALYDDASLADALAIDPSRAREIIALATPRPVTPAYTQLSQILQVRLHRALTGQAEPAEALSRAAEEMRALLEEVGLAPGATASGSSR